MEINQAGLDLIKNFEGCKLTSYQDGAGIWTIGYGHTGIEIGPDQTINQDQADAFLASDVTVTSSRLNRLIIQDLNSNQFSACVVFAYNVGVGAFRGSTMLTLINQGNYDAAAAEFPKWDKVAGTPCNGLLRRRLAEQALFIKPDEVTP